MDYWYNRVAKSNKSNHINPLLCKKKHLAHCLKKLISPDKLTPMCVHVHFEMNQFCFVNVITSTSFETYNACTNIATTVY